MSLNTCTGDPPGLSIVAVLVGASVYVGGSS